MNARSRWLVPALLVLAIGLQPSLSEAKGFGRGGSKGGGSSSGSKGSSSSSGSKGSSSGGFGRGGSSRSSGSSSSGRTTYSFRGNAPRESARFSSGSRYGSSGPYYGARTAIIVGAPAYYGYYSGWGVYPWGYYSYGYYPIWGAPSAPVSEPDSPTPEMSQQPRTRAFSLYLGGAAQSQGFAPAGSLHFEGKRWGFNFQGIALVSEPLGENQSAMFMPLLSSHVTYSVISSPHLRLRAEVGVSGVFAPTVNYIGPDIGTSAQLALLGPLAVQGSLRYTPVPARILDAEVGLGLNFGGLGLKAGWRTLRLDDSRIDPDGGTDYFNGPTVAIGAIY